MKIKKIDQSYYESYIEDWYKEWSSELNQKMSKKYKERRLYLYSELTRLFKAFE